MKATRPTSGPEPTFPPKPCAHRGAWIVLGTLLAILAASSPLPAQQPLFLAQSPAGPLLDDSSQNHSLHQPPGVLLGENEPAPSIEAPPNAQGLPLDELILSPPGNFYPDGSAPQIGPDDDAAELLPPGQCPYCGSGLGHTCPSCSPLPGLGDASLGIGPSAPLGLGAGRLAARGRQWLEPMTRESWLYRPLSVGWFMGFLQGGELIDDWVGQEQGYFGGYRLGWDVDPSWGWETRFGFASVALGDSARAVAAQEENDLIHGLTPDDPYFHRFDTRRDCGVRVWDLDLLWYPFGDTYFRPYLFLGLGAARVDFIDRLSDRTIKSVLEVPMGIGFKYRVREWLALRVELTDNFILGAGSGFQNLHDLSLTAGMEVRFGGTRTAYWPYSPGRHYW